MYSSGSCDCGDREAWKPEGFCRDHAGSVDESLLDTTKIYKRGEFI